MFATIVVCQFLCHHAAFAHTVPGLWHGVWQVIGQLHPGLIADSAGIAAGTTVVGIGVNHAHKVDRRTDIVTGIGVKGKLCPCPERSDHLVAVGGTIGDTPAIFQFVGAEAWVGNAMPRAEFQLFYWIGVAEDPGCRHGPTAVELIDHRPEVGVGGRWFGGVGAHRYCPNADGWLILKADGFADGVVVTIGVGVHLTWVNFQLERNRPCGNPRFGQLEEPAIVEPGAVIAAAGCQCAQPIDGL